MYMLRTMYVVHQCTCLQLNRSIYVRHIMLTYMYVCQHSAVYRVSLVVYIGVFWRLPLRGFGFDPSAVQYNLPLKVCYVLDGTRYSLCSFPLQPTKDLVTQPLNFLHESDVLYNCTSLWLSEMITLFNVQAVWGYSLVCLVQSNVHVPTNSNRILRISACAHNAQNKLQT